jgi:hypothetical protein
VFVFVSTYADMKLDVCMFNVPVVRLFLIVEILLEPLTSKCVKYSPIKVLPVNPTPFDAVSRRVLFVFVALIT